MAVLSVYHPDIFEFINAKSYNEGKLVHFNLSVMVDDDFMKAVKNDSEIFLHYPVYDDKGFLVKDENKWKIKKTINARKLYDMIIRKAYDNGEPGILYYDNMNRDNNLWYMENIVNTNPCFTGDMKLLTSKGYKSFSELSNKEIEIININGEFIKGKVWKTGQKKTIKLILSNGHEITCTPDHVFMGLDEKEYKAKDLKGIKIMPYTGNHKIFDDEYVKYGFIQGDGYLGRLDSKHHKGLEVNIGKKDNDILFLFRNNKFTKRDREIYLQDNYKDKLIELGFDSNNLPNRAFPSTYDEWTNLQKASFLQGCYSANGCVVTKYRISYKTTSRKFANKLVKTLFDDFNIKAYITANKSKNVKFNNGTYLCRESYDVNISRYESIQKFHNEINFYQLYKKIALRNLLKYKAPYVTNIIDNGVKTVYDFNEPKTHWGVVEGYIAHNCGEYISGVIYDSPKLTTKSLDKFYGACNLGSLFLHNYVKEPFTKNANIDYSLLKEAINAAVRFLDNIIDINFYPLTEFENYQSNLRTIGLGVTGLADALVMLNVKYGSKDSIKIIDNLMNFIAKEAYKSSIKLAKEKGAFPLLDSEKFIQSGYIQKHIKKDNEWNNIADDILKYGIRNARILSVAPTGTLSLTYGNNCSSGIEPIFSLEYDRKVRIGGQEEKNEKTVKMRDYAYDIWLQNKNYLNNIVNRDVFVTAMDLSVREHLEVLKIVAFHIDQSVSKTINIPTEYPFEDVKKVYEYCWENGIKGCTIFRPNKLRQGILLTENDKSKKHTELPRGMIYSISDDMIGRKSKIITGCGNLHLQAWFDPLTGDIMEVFLAKGSDGGCNSYMIGTSRLISLALRGGIPLSAVVDQLTSSPSCPSYVARKVTKKDTSKGNCCPTAIGKVLVDLQNQIKDELFDDCDKEQDTKIQDNTTVNSSIKNNITKEEVKYLSEYGEVPYAIKYNKCPQCHEAINHVEGCISCASCGWTKC